MQIRTMSAIFLSATTIVAATATRADASPFRHGLSSSQNLVDPFSGVDSIETGGGDSLYSDFVLDQFTSSGVWATGDTVIEGLYVASIEDGPGGESWYSSFVLNQFTLPNVTQRNKPGLFFGALKEWRVDHPQDGPVPTPEPGTLLLVATGMAGAAVRKYRRKQDAR